MLSSDELPIPLEAQSFATRRFLEAELNKESGPGVLSFSLSLNLNMSTLNMNDFNMNIEPAKCKAEENNDFLSKQNILATPERSILVQICSVNKRTRREAS